MYLDNDGTETFDILFSDDNIAEITIPESWDNGTGYLDNGAHDPLPNVADGSILKGRDHHGRRVVVLKVRERNNVVFFERYPGTLPIVWNAHSGAEELLNTFRTITESAMRHGAFASLAHKLGA